VLTVVNWLFFMKKLLFACLLFPPLSAQAMDGPEFLKTPLKARFLISGEDSNTSSYILDKPLKFYRLAKNEIPTETYTIEWKEMTYPPQKGNSAQKENVPAYANCLSSQKEPVIFYEEETLEIYFDPRRGKAFLDFEKDTTVGYILEESFQSRLSEKLKFKETDAENAKNTKYIKTDKTQKVIVEDIEKSIYKVKNSGFDKLWSNNRHLVWWIESFFEGANPHRKYYSIHRKTFSSAAKLLRGIFGGKIVLKPRSQPDVYLKAKICGQTFLLPKRGEKETRSQYESRMITSFHDFLQRCGFYIENGKLALPK
jgi:hypothetical protein